MIPDINFAEPYETFRGISMHTDEFRCQQYAFAFILANFYPKIASQLKNIDLNKTVSRKGFEILFLDEFIYNTFPKHSVSYGHLLGKKRNVRINQERIPQLAERIEGILSDGFLYVEGDCHAEAYVLNQRNGTNFVHRLKDEDYGKNYWEFGKVMEWLKSSFSISDNDEILESDLNKFNWEFGDTSNSRFVPKYVCDRVFDLHPPEKVMANLLQGLSDGSVKKPYRVHEL